MKRLNLRLFVALVMSLAAMLLLAACGGAPSAPPTPTEAVQADVQSEEVEPEEKEVESEHLEDDEHMDDEHMDESEHMDEGENEHGHEVDEHMSGAGHEVPEEAAAVPNPIEANDESLEAGAASYAVNCVVCHGENGEGDGPAAAALEKKPAALHEAHVQELSDGALFYIITHGRPDTPMPAWEDVLSEEERWHVVNFLREFRE